MFLLKGGYSFVAVLLQIITHTPRPSVGASSGKAPRRIAVTTLLSGDVDTTPSTGGNGPSDMEKLDSPVNKESSANNDSSKDKESSKDKDSTTKTTGSVRRLTLTTLS